MWVSPYIECGVGWKKLYQPVIDKAEELDVSIFQIKEKYGSLRIYLGGGPVDDEGNPLLDYETWEELRDMADGAEDESYYVCETCGDTGSLRGYSWMYTSCDKHIREGDIDGPNE